MQRLTPKSEVGRQAEARCEVLDVVAREEIDPLQNEEVAPAGQSEVKEVLLLYRAAETLNVESDDAQISDEGRK